MYNEKKEKVSLLREKINKAETSADNVLNADGPTKTAGTLKLIVEALKIIDDRLNDFENKIKPETEEKEETKNNTITYL